MYTLELILVDDYTHLKMELVISSQVDKLSRPISILLLCQHPLPPKKNLDLLLS